MDETKTNIETLRNMRIIDMTGEQFMTLVAAAVPAAGNGVGEIPPLVYGISGLARLLGCSDTTAWRHRKSGKFDAATMQLEDTLVFDSRKVLEIMGKNKTTNN